MAGVSTAHVGLDPILECLCRHERRFVVEYLEDRDEPVSLEELATALAGHADGDDAPGDATPTDELWESLRYRHLPKLVADGVVVLEDDGVRLRHEGAGAIVQQLRPVCAEIETSDEIDLAREAPGATHETYTRDQDRTMPEALVAAIWNHREDDLLRTDYLLFENVDANALDALFHDDAEPYTSVVFTTDTVRIELWCDDGVQIRVSDVPG